jgi:HAD superfamily hydrolase (TIGR01450 family)
MWLDRYRGLLCDLDGCLVLGGRPLPGAQELITYAGDRLFIVSNNSIDTPKTLAGKLARIGLPVAMDRIALAGATAVEQLAASARGAHTAIYGSPAIIAYATSLGLVVDDEHPDVVLLTRDVRFSYARLHRIVRQIENGAQLVVSNLDLSHPGAAGARIFETGVLLETVKACLPDLRYRPIGKPSPVLYQAAMCRISAVAEELLAIGDNPTTDGEGARRMGIGCILVGPSAGAQFTGLAAMMQCQDAPRLFLDKKRGMGKANRVPIADSGRSLGQTSPADAKEAL